MSFASWKQIQLKAKLNPADDSLTADIDVWVTNGRIYFLNDLQEEWMSFDWVAASGSNFVYSNLVRWLSQTADPATAWTWLTWLAGNIWTLVQMHDQMADTKTSNTWTWTQTVPDIRFSWTTTSGLRVKSLTTAQRNALTAANWDIVYDSTEWVHYQYIWGAWSTFATWSTPNASETVAGKVEFNTTAQSISANDTWETWALTVNHPSDIAKNIQSNTYVYWTDAWWDDTYVVSLTPTLTTYTTWQTLSFKPSTSNTWACTIDFWPWVKNIKLIDWTDPVDWDITANNIYELVYDWTNFILQTQLRTTNISTGFTLWETITAWTWISIGNSNWKAIKSWYFEWWTQTMWSWAWDFGVLPEWDYLWNTFITWYKLSSNNRGYLRAWTISENTITLWTEQELSTASLSWAKMRKIDTDKFILIFDTNAIVSSKAWTISGTTITLWSQTDLLTWQVNTSISWLCNLWTDKFIASYNWNVWWNLLRVWTVSGTTITLWTWVTQIPWTLKKVTTDKAVIVYNNSWYKIKNITVSGTTITLNSEISITGTTFRWVSNVDNNIIAVAMDNSILFFDVSWTNPSLLSSFELPQSSISYTNCDYENWFLYLQTANRIYVYRVSEWMSLIPIFNKSMTSYDFNLLVYLTDWKFLRTGWTSWTNWIAQINRYNYNIWILQSSWVLNDVKPCYISNTLASWLSWLTPWKMYANGYAVTSTQQIIISN